MTWPKKPTYLPTYLLTYLPTLRHKTILQTCDNWDIDYNSYNWEPEFMTIFVIWQSRVTLDSIRNFCDVFFNKTWRGRIWRRNIARIANAVQCHSWLSGNKDCHEFRFSIVRIVISVSNVKSLHDCQILQNCQICQQFAKL